MGDRLNGVEQGICRKKSRMKGCISGKGGEPGLDGTERKYGKKGHLAGRISRELG